jgi:hypothetical protein
VLPNNPPPLPLACRQTVFVQGDGHVLALQPLYNDPYTILQHSLHHVTLQIGDKTDKVSTVRLKPCSDPTVPPAQPRARGRPPVVRFRDFPLSGVTAAHRVHFGLPCAEELAGTVSPWAAARGFCTPLCRSTANISPAGT